MASMRNRGSGDRRQGSGRQGTGVRGQGSGKTGDRENQPHAKALRR